MTEDNEDNLFLPIAAKWMMLLLMMMMMMMMMRTTTMIDLSYRRSFHFSP